MCYFFVWANEASDFGLCLLSSISGAETAKRYGVPKMGHFIKYWTRLCRGIFFLPCPNRNKKVKVLVIQQKRIGDVLVGTSICNNLRKRFPEAEIHVYDISFYPGCGETQPQYR